MEVRMDSITLLLGIVVVVVYFLRRIKITKIHIANRNISGNRHRR
jgi:hypothetical protein